MKARSPSRVIGHRKSKKQKIEKVNLTSIAERYMELRRLRERLMQAEARLAR